MIKKEDVSIELLRALTVAMHSMKYNPEVDTLTEQSYSYMLCGLREKLGEYFLGVPILT
jgi:hypothetical protein